MLKIKLRKQEYGGKIVVHNEKIVWTFNPERKLKKSQGTKVR